MVRDISILVRQSTPEWPGDTPFSCGWTARLSEGQSVNLSAIHMSPHVGTHADAPLHVRDGQPASDALPVDAFLGRTLVLGVEGRPRDLKTDEILPRLPAGTTRVLLRTGVSIVGGSFPADWPALTVDAAHALVARGVVLLGVDAPSVDRRESRTLGVHHALFGGGAWVLENLDLTGVADGVYELIAPPLRVAGLDAAPVRALLRPLSAPAAGP
jgi:arylformamidase